MFLTTKWQKEWNFIPHEVPFPVHMQWTLYLSRDEVMVQSQKCCSIKRQSRGRLETINPQYGIIRRLRRILEMRHWVLVTPIYFLHIQHFQKATERSRIRSEHWNMGKWLLKLSQRLQTHKSLPDRMAKQNIVRTIIVTVCCAFALHPSARHPWHFITT